MYVSITDWRTSARTSTLMFGASDVASGVGCCGCWLWSAVVVGSLGVVVIGVPDGCADAGWFVICAEIIVSG